MAYIVQTLSAGEELRSRFRLHWSCHTWLYLTALLTVGSAGILSPLLIFEWLRLRSIEMGVTTRRVIHKRGIIGRSTQEMRLEAVEAVEMSQGAWGRLLGRGTVRVYGRGTSDVVFRAVRQPLEVKRELEAAVSLV
jgi:hypothetical protein